MAARTVHTLPAGRLCAAALTVLGAASFLPPIAAARQLAAPLDTFVTARVRGLGHRAAVLVNEGRARSATFRNLCDRLEQSDVIVLVKTGAVRSSPAVTAFITSSPGARFLAITVRVPELDDVLLGWLAHELQHAVEIASAREVVDAKTMIEFFETHGQMMPNYGPYTREAQRVRNIVDYELAVSRAARDGGKLSESGIGIQESAWPVS